MKRALICFVAITALVVGATGVTPAAAGGFPDPYNDAFHSDSFQVTGDYTPLLLDNACGSGPAEIMVFWYGEGAAPDHLWGITDVDPLEHTSMPVTVNGVYEPFVGDFDYDGCDDVFWYAPGPAADHVWFGDGDGAFTSEAASVNGTYEPVVGEFNDAEGTDVFWYAPGPGAESLWTGAEDRTFGQSGAPQVNGTYRAVGIYSSIFFHAPGAAQDYFWSGVSAGGVDESAPVEVNGTYTPLAGPESILLYAPGPAKDYAIVGFGETGVETVSATINGDYVPAVRGPGGSEAFLWHAPGAALDHLWVVGLS